MACANGSMRSTALSLVTSLIFGVTSVLVSLSRVSAQDGGAPSASYAIAPAEFIGAAACANCHPGEHEQWQGSQHAVAMQEANEKTVLGNFDSGTFSQGGVTSIFFKKDGRWWVRTDGPEGALADFEIRFTFGIYPLQQYLIEMPNGRFQALGIAWDARPKEEGGQRWFHLYPGQHLKAGHPLHWTGIDQNWNYQCAYCHSTNLRKNYNSATGKFNTTWSEINVACEACHGPASHHVAWASKAGEWRSLEAANTAFMTRFKERPTRWVMTESGTAKRSVAPKSSKEVEACAVCHARRQQFSDDSKAQAQSFFDAFRPSLLSPGLYHVDGQQREEVYNYGSFLQSKMYAAGVTCSDCHNPHPGKLRAPGNAVCTQCHAPEKFDAPAHHHHPAGSKGAECAACHMPMTTYMILDPRHDHSIRIPRPDRTYLLGTPNACNQCHSDKTAGWARDALKTWYPSPKPGAQDFAEAFDLGDRGAPGAQIALIRIAEAGSQSGIARASAISRLGRFPSPQALDLAIQSLKVDDLNVRAAAISLIAGADLATRRSVLAPLLHDKTRLIRMDAARALAGEAERDLAPDDRKALEAALAEYVEAQLFNAERPETHANLGNLYRDRGKLDAARPAFAKAIEIDPTFVAAAISLADLRRTEGNESEAEAVLRQALSANPGSGPVQHALGLSLIRQKRATEAMVYLDQAARAAPEEPRFSYVYAVALHDMGQQADAIEVLKGALTRQPYDRDILWALASYEVAARDYTSALKRAELLNELEPGRPDIVRMVNAIRRQAG